MNSGYMPDKLKKFVNENYTDYKSDTFSAFIVRNDIFTKSYGHIGMLTPYVWMFISSYEKLRRKLIQDIDITSLVQLEYNAFESACVPVVAFTFVKSNTNFKGEYIKLSEFKGCENQEPRTLEAVRNKNCGYRYSASKKYFAKIPGAPVAYWVSEKLTEAFTLKTLYDYTISPSQNVTGNNNRFLRKFWELAQEKIDLKDNWIFYAKGGGYRKWWGNLYDVINWTPEARNIYQYGDGLHASQIINKDYWYKKGITWGLITSALPSFRIMPEGATFDKGGSTIIVDEFVYNFTLGLLNSKVYIPISELFNPTLNFQVKDIRSLPVKLEYKAIVDQLVENNIFNSKSDWDAFETSWDFTKHPLLRNKLTISEAYAEWETECNARFAQLKANEEELNRIFIDIYGLQDELTPEVEDKDVTVRKADLQRDIKSLLSYAVGCMFGRYSLDVEGLAFAGGTWDDSKYVTFKPDEDNVIPITDEDYFEDDIIGRLIAWLKVVYGAETLEENLRFIADALGTSGDTARQKIRNYFLKDFFKDHCKIYQKRHIYWLYDSGKQNGFKALIYMHRYNADTSGQVRAEYLGKMEETYESEINRMQDIMDNGAGREVALAGKRKEKLQKQLHECRDYDAVLGHIALASIAIDLDDGVKVNYVKVQTAKDGKLLPILAKI